MQALHTHDERVACASEQHCLATSASVACALTVGSLRRSLPAEAQVAALGVGADQDTPVVAHQGWWLHLLDGAVRLRETAVACLESAGREGRAVPGEPAGCCGPSAPSPLPRARLAVLCCQGPWSQPVRPRLSTACGA
jgi:hypothetical protein